MLLGEVKLVLDDSRSGGLDVCRSSENVDQSDVRIAQARVFGICSEETTKLGFVIERGLEGLIEGDRDALRKGGDSGDESLCLWSLGHVTDVGRPWKGGRARLTYLCVRAHPRAWVTVPAPPCY